MKLHQLHSDVLEEGIGREIIKSVGDLVGLIPGAGEAADVGVAVMHLQDREYFEAAMSLISIIPAIGDLPAKGGKYAFKLLKGMKKFNPKIAKEIMEAITKHGPKIKKGWDGVVVLAKKVKKLEPYIREMKEAVDEFFKTIKKMKRQLETKAQPV